MNRLRVTLILSRLGVTPRRLRVTLSVLAEPIFTKNSVFSKKRFGQRRNLFLLKTVFLVKSVRLLRKNTKPCSIERSRCVDLPRLDKTSVR